MEKVIAVFDIGKTNKKFILFDQRLNVVRQKEISAPAAEDEDGFECDDIDFLERWIKYQLVREIRKGVHEIIGVNFSTFGASLVFLDKAGKRLTPLYNYLKPVPEDVSRYLYGNNGGINEFCRKTASPPLDGLLNSGKQILWLKMHKKDVFQKVKHILHLPQYLSYLFTGRVVSEFTSIGCHTAMWDFDKMEYHEWLKNEGIFLPEPVSDSFVHDVSVEGKKVSIGCGIHDSSSSLAPYMMKSPEKFILVSTGTWCINMNPYNYSPLTAEELEQDCLCYLSIDEKPVKSSRLFMGHIHDVNAKRLAGFFGNEQDAFMKVDPDESLIRSFLDQKEPEKTFFQEGVPAEFVDHSIDLSKFSSFEEAYQRLIFDLTRLNVKAIELISDHDDEVKNIYISGGFARNEIYTRLMANFFPNKSVFTSEIDNATALGAAMVIGHVLTPDKEPVINMNRKKWEGF